MAHYDCDGCGAAGMGMYTGHAPGCPDDPANQLPYHKGEKILSAPPIGLRPKKFATQDRMWEIFQAITRYMEDAKKIPQEWIDEFAELNKGL